MPTITLPNGSQRNFSNPVTIMQVAEDISPSLAKTTIAGRVDGVLVDACELISRNATLNIITKKESEGLNIIRHSFAHLIGHAVKQLYPTAKMAIGPVIDEGFYYDIAYKRPFTPDDLADIEKRINELVKTNYDIVKTMTPISDARQKFIDRGETYKIALIDNMDKSVKEVGLYRHGEYIDMCLGPHVPNTRVLRHFKLIKLAGAYWRGNSNNEMLQRIYGTAWNNKKELNVYLTRIEEAERRDHRKLGKKLDLFHVQKEAPGMVFWHPKGWRLYQAVEQYMRKKQLDNSYQEVKTPQIVDRVLWEKSGHWDKYHENMFATHSEHRDYAVKPMNCPCHIQIYNQSLRSYRDLPFRIAEFGSCHRNEPSGSLHGIMRVRNFVQDDGHIFVTESQIQQEVSEFIHLLHEVYTDFGFNSIIYRLSTRPEQRVGSNEIWDKAEKALADALTSARLNWEKLPGDGAFYGPKIEFSLKDAIGRVWQCGTIQVDFSMPTRLGAQYVSRDGSRQTPVMLHRAIIGSLERFIGILIEETKGSFPVWLAPEQVAIMSITDRQADYCSNLGKRLNSNGFRSKLDLRNEKIGFKIREHTIQQIPYLVIIGDKEVDQVSVRTRAGEDLGVMSISSFEKLLQNEITHRGHKQQMEI